MENQNMPTMPTMNENKNDDVSGNASSASLLGGEGSSDSSPSAEQVLDAPDHVETKPDYIVPGKADSDVKIPLVPKSGIKVIALRKGFFGQQRIAEGAGFIVKRFEQLGEWMKCEDPAIEKERIEFFKKKKARK